MSRLKLVVVLAGATLLLALGCGDSDLATGEACTADTECAEAKCHAGICVAAAPKDIGAVCTNKGECKSMNCAAAKCAAGSTAKEAACLNNDECASGNCDATTKKCGLKTAGKACTAAAECLGGGCVDSKCVKTCTKTADCASGEVCHSKDMKTAFCLKPTYNTDIGMKCGIDGLCTGTASCKSTISSDPKYDAASWCTMDCKTDLDCPPSLACGKIGTSTVCQPRGFCSACVNDSFCPAGYKCAGIHGGKYCTRACTKGGTDCPMYAECKADSAGNSVCQNKTGKCVGDGTDCSPCQHDGQCKGSATCFSMNLSYEKFCSTDCSSGAACANGTQCASLSSGGKKCIPATKGSPPWYSCASAGITFPVYQVGDIFPDFEMVGLADSDSDGDLLDEKLSYVKLSDFSSRYSAILFNIMTFW